jgi:prepilin signal peptidase PulO-like enzyme (type II secretory pathway)
VPGQAEFVQQRQDAGFGIGQGRGLAAAFGGGKLAWTSRIAFGPHLALSFWLVWLFGPVVMG